MQFTSYKLGNVEGVKQTPIELSVNKIIGGSPLNFRFFYVKEKLYVCINSNVNILLEEGQAKSINDDLTGYIAMVENVVYYWLSNEA